MSARTSRLSPYVSGSRPVPVAAFVLSRSRFLFRGTTVPVVTGMKLPLWDHLRKDCVADATAFSADEDEPSTLQLTEQCADVAFGHVPEARGECPLGGRTW